MDDIVESRKYHEHQNDRETDARPHLLSPFRQRTPPCRLDGIEQKVSAIEKGNRKQVQKTDRNRKYGSKMDKRHESDACHLAGDLRNPNRAAELVGGLAPHD